jgi:hypothetical protein
MIVDWLSFGALIGYVILTYLIWKEKYEPLISFYLNKMEEKSHIGFNMTNMSNVEVEVFGIIWVRVNNNLFEHKGGFYGNKKHWILQPKTKVFGHFHLTNLEDNQGKKIEDFLMENKENSISFNMEIKYRRILKNHFLRKLLKKRGWKKTSPQNYIHNFENGDFWLDV